MVLIVLLALMFVGGLTAGCGASSGTPSTKIVHGLGPSGHEDADGDHDFHPLTGDYGGVALAQDRRSVSAISTGATGTRAIESLQSGKGDSDNDTDNYQAILSYGSTADAEQQRAVMRAVKRYYAVAASGDGAKGCSLLVPDLAAKVTGEFGHTRYLRGSSCAAILSRLFAHAHAELAVDRHTLEVLPVRVKGNLAVALLAWARLSREGQIVLLRQHGTWLLDGLIDGPRPIDGEAR